MEDEYIDEYGFNSLEQLKIASGNAEVFVTNNEKVLQDREELEKKFSIKIMSPLEILEGKTEDKKCSSVGGKDKMGKKVFNPKTMMMGALYDAEQAGKTGNGEKAINILEKKLGELKKIQCSDYMRLEW